jgi:hypothetical protein
MEWHATCKMIYQFFILLISYKLKYENIDNKNIFIIGPISTAH